MTALGDVPEPPLVVDWQLPSPVVAITADHCSGVALAPGNTCTIEISASPVDDHFFEAGLRITGWNVGGVDIEGIGLPAPSVREPRAHPARVPEIDLDDVARAHQRR